MPCPRRIDAVPYRINGAIDVVEATYTPLSLRVEKSLHLGMQFIQHCREGWKIGDQRAKGNIPSAFHIFHYARVKEILGAFEINVPQPAFVMEAGTEVDQVQWSQ